MPSATYWRLLITQAYNTTSISELKFFDSGGTQIPTTGGTASASSLFSPSFPASNAFDGSLSTFWAAAATPTPLSPQWIQYQFTSAVSVASLSITGRPDINSNQTPENFQLQYSNDGSTWTTLYSYLGANWGASTPSPVQTFNAGNQAQSTGVMWRLLITGATINNNTCAIAEWKLYDSLGIQYDTSAYSSTSSSNFTAYAAQGAFDGSLSTFWAAAATPSVSVPVWVAYQFTDPTVTPAKFSLTARNDSQWGQAPDIFSLQKSTDGGVTWTTISSWDLTTGNADKDMNWAFAGQTLFFGAPTSAIVNETSLSTILTSPSPQAYVNELSLTVILTSATAVSTQPQVFVIT